MRSIAVAAVLGLALMAGAGSADAKGCLKGAAVGGVAGHVAGHGAMGAAAGCAVGHHEANKEDKARSDQARADAKDH
jgi:hypothetical protein